MINPDVLVGMKQYYAKVANPEKSEKRENLEYFWLVKLVVVVITMSSVQFSISSNFRINVQHFLRLTNKLSRFYLYCASLELCFR